jgi:PAS domain S-box-containing protein
MPIAAQSRHAQHLLDFAAGADMARTMGRARQIVGMRADGTTFPIEASIFKAKSERETVLTAILRDVTQAREMSAALERSEEHYRELFEQHPVPMWVFDTTTLGFLAVNEAAIRKYGWPREEFLKLNLLDVRPPEEAERTLESVRQTVPREFTISGIWTHKLRSGELVKIEASGRALTWDGRPARMAVLYDVTERERAMAEISRRREQLVELSRELMDKEAFERRRLSQVLHDRFAQNLAAAKLALETARLRGVAPELLQPAVGVLEDALQEVRGLLHDLRPPLLDDFGLRAALHFEIERRQIADGPGIRFAPVAEGLVETRLDGTVEYGMFGIAREALANALFHAGARRIDVSLELHADSAHLVVRDDGVGFTAADEERARHHLGLVSMRERAGWIGATLAVVSAPGQGTVVKLDWRAAKGTA